MKLPDKKNRYWGQVLLDEEYRFLKYYPIVIDVGACVGAFSAYIYDFADKIYAIEPIPKNVEQIEELVRMNNLEKISISQLAISGKSGPRKMIVKGDPTDGGNNFDEVGDVDVATMSLRDFIDNGHIEYVDLLKLDVEGAEMEIFADPFFPHRRIGTIIGEHHFPDERIDTFKKLVDTMGYQWVPVKGNHFLLRK